MQTSPELLYANLKQLIVTAPDLTVQPLSRDTMMWLGRANALVELVSPGIDAVELSVAAKNLKGPLRTHNAETILLVLHRALAKIELQAPAAARGAFVAVGQSFDALSAVAGVLSEAKHNIMFVDPYADHRICTDFCILAPPQVSISILTDENNFYRSLLPVLRSWERQNGSSRPLEARAAPPRSIHDRALLIDGRIAWTVGQSFKDLAARAMTSIVRDDPETAGLKIAALNQLWEAAAPI